MSILKSGYAARRAERGKLDLDFRVLEWPDPRVGERRSVPGRFEHGAEVVGVLFGKVAGKADADDASRRVMPEDEGRKADRGRNRFLRPGIVALCRCSGWCSKNLKARIMASTLGPACPRAIGCKGAAGAFIRL
ncbi:MAG: hypothetical protein WCC90_07200 [Methylocella sp.]